MLKVVVSFGSIDFLCIKYKLLVILWVYAIYFSFFLLSMLRTVLP
jgi:hypothetical protein